MRHLLNFIWIVGYFFIAFGGAYFGIPGTVGAAGFILLFTVIRLELDNR